MPPLTRKMCGLFSPCAIPLFIKQTKTHCLRMVGGLPGHRAGSLITITNLKGYYMGYIPTMSLKLLMPISHLIDFTKI
jgi:hypothetical protein